MSLLRKLKLWKDVFGPHSKGPLDPLQAAQDSLLNKSSKLDLAERAVMTQHLADIAHDEIDAARRARARSGLGPTMPADKPDDMGNIIVCDDFHQNDPPRPPLPQPSRAWPMAAGIALGGGLIAVALALPSILDRMKQPQPQPVQAQPEPAKPAQPGGTTTIKKGFVIDLPGAQK